jgi:hypothetical protein
MERSKVERKGAATSFQRGKERGSESDVFGADFEALVLVFPDDCGVILQEAGGQMSGLGEQLFRFFGRFFKGRIIVSRTPALAIVPMGHGVDGSVTLGPAA